MGPGKRVVSILKHVLIKLFVFFLGDLSSISGPERFILIDSLELYSLYSSGGSSIDGIFDFLLVDFFSFFSPLLSHLFDFGFDLGLSLLDFLFRSYDLLQIDWVTDETTVSLDQILQFVVFAIFICIFFEEEPHHGSSFKLDGIVRFNCEDIRGGRSPFMLNVVVRLGYDFYFGGHQERGVESHTELSNQIELSCFKVLEELGGA